MAVHPRRIGPLFSILVVALVGAAMLTQNVRPRGPYVVRERYPDEIWDIRTTSRGWPFPYYENIEASLVASRFGNFRGPINIVKCPWSGWRNPQTLSLVADIILGSLMLIATAIASEYWRRHRTGPFQFGLQTLLIATTLVAGIISLLDNAFLHWSVLLSPAIAAGIVSVPAVVGLTLDYYVRRSDRRLSLLRSRVAAHDEVVQYETHCDRK